MDLDQKAILSEMQALERQRAEALANLHRIDGAMEMCRHLLKKQATPEEVPAPPAAE